MSGWGRQLSAGVLALAVTGLAGCGTAFVQPIGGGSSLTGRTQHQILVSYVASAQHGLPGVLKAAQGRYSALAVVAEDPGTIVYRFVFARQLRRVATARYLRGQTPTLTRACENTLFPDMARVGITQRPRVRYEYLNHDRTTVFTYTCVPR